MTTIFRRATSVLVLIGLTVGPGVAVASEVRLRSTATIYLDAKGAAIRAPESLDFHGGSLLVVADSGNRRVLLYDVAGDRITPRSEIRLSQMPYPIRVRVDSEGEILALDGKRHRIVRIDPGGTFKGYVEPATGERQDTVLPRSFDVDDGGDLWILDVAGSRILVVAKDGSVKRQIAFGPEVGFLSDLTVNRSGVVFAVDSVHSRLFVARKNDSTLSPLTEALKGHMTFPIAIDADDLGNLYLADQYAGRILILGEDGSFRGRQSARGWKEGFLRHPSGLSAGAGSLFVADRSNNRVQRFAIVP